MSLILALLTTFALPLIASAGESAPSVDEQVASLEQMCADNADAMKTRHGERSLYDRLGGREKIHAIVTDVVRLHGENESIVRTLEGVDRDHLVDMVTEFLVVGSGGPGKYTGRDMVSAHAHLKLTNADFLSAGGDVIQAMKLHGCGEEEIQEVVCALVSFRKAVVIDSDREVSAKSSR